MHCEPPPHTTIGRGGTGYFPLTLNLVGITAGPVPPRAVGLLTNPGLKKNKGRNWLMGSSVVAILKEPTFPGFVGAKDISVFHGPCRRGPHRKREET